MLMAFVKIAISAALLWVLFDNVDGGEVIDQLSRARPDLLGLGIAALLALAVVQAYRWTVVLQMLGVRLAAGQAILIVLIGQFFNQTLPSTIGGDAVRIWRVHKLGLNLAAAVHGVMLDRLSALLALLLVAAVGLPRIHSLLGGGPAFWAVPIFIAAGIAGFAVLMSFDRLPSAFTRWRIVAAGYRLSADARTVLLNRRTTPWMLLVSLFIQVSVSTVVFTVAAALGIEAGWFDCLILVPPVMLISMIPISIAGWGVREGAMVTAFGLIGVAAADALALSVLFGLMVSLVGVPGGIIWALTRPRRDAADGAPAMGADTGAMPPRS